jgi:uncharacterized metal-binding protein
MILACSGGLNVGQLSNQAAVDRVKQAAKATCASAAPA